MGRPRGPGRQRSKAEEGAGKSNDWLPQLTAGVLQPPTRDCGSVGPEGHANPTKAVQSSDWNRALLDTLKATPTPRRLSNRQIGIARCSIL